MPIFFFDCFDGDRLHRDGFGVDLASEADVPEEATALAIALTGEAAPGAAPRTVSVEVRDAGGRPVYAARIEAAGRWLASSAA